MEERIIDEEIGRKIKVKKLQDGEQDVVDELAEGEENETVEGEEEDEELTFEIPDLEEDDEDLACLSPEEAAALRQKKKEEAEARKAEYESTVAAGMAFLEEGSYHAAELQFEKALLLDDVATEASVGYWRAKTEDFSNPDALMDEYVEPGYENLEFDLGYEAVDIIKAEYKAQFQRRYDELLAEEAPLKEEVYAAQERRRAILKPRRKKRGIAFAIAALPFLTALVLTVVLGLKNFTVRDNSFIMPTIISGCVALVTFIVFGVFTNRFINACRIYRENERIDATDDGARLQEIAEYKELYEKFL
ncbi:MAG: hypothetical protein J6A87_00495 [Clostridia bacterium]|nr:hypothetical protein [Clostridia bacterium]